jgi:hypothetical protein
MSSYDDRTQLQILVDEKIWKYERRAKELSWTARNFKPDEEILKQIKLLLSDLKEIKSLVDKSNGGVKHGHKC